MAKLVIREKLDLTGEKTLCEAIEELKKKLPKKKIKKDDQGKEIERIKEVITDLIENTGFTQAHPPDYGVEEEIDPGG